METKPLTIVTHNATYHADDVFAVATLLGVLEREGKSATIIRSRAEEDIMAADYVVDVGGVYDPGKKRFDHHQKETAGGRKNGILYASFGLVWKEYGSVLCGGDVELAEKIDRGLVASVDANDTGTDFSQNLFEGYYTALLPSHFMIFQPVWNEESTDEILYKKFIEAVAAAKKYLERLIVVQKASLDAAREIRARYENAADKKIVVFKKNYGRINFIQTLTKLPGILFYVYPDSHGTWTAETVPAADGSFEKRKDFPIAWKGLRDESFASVSGVSDAIFCHNSLFMTKAKTLDGALALAKIALES